MLKNIKNISIILSLVTAIILLKLLFVIISPWSNPKPEPEYTPFIHRCFEPQINSVIKHYKVSMPLKFLPGQDKCILDINDRGQWYTQHYRDLKEFIITKNNKYCLWDSENWDDECQDIAMEYAYGEYNYRKSASTITIHEFKEVLVNFIRYVQEGKFQQAAELMDEYSGVSTGDPPRSFEQEMADNKKYCENYVESRLKRRCIDVSQPFFQDNLKQIDVDNIKFYLADTATYCAYSIVIPFIYKGEEKILIVKYKCEDILRDTEPYDRKSLPILSRISIYNKNDD